MATTRRIPDSGSVNFAFVPPQHSHRESSLHWMIEKMGGIVFDFGRAIDYATQWVDYSESSAEVKENAGQVKGVIGRVNVFFSGCSLASATHELLDAEDVSVGEVTGVLSSGAEFLDRLDGLGAINLMKGASPVIAGIGVAADVVGGLYDSAGVLSDDHIKASDSRGLARAKESALYKWIKIAENVTFIALAALSGYATYCTVFAVAASAALPFTLLAVGTAALSIKMMRCFYEGLAEDGRPQNLEVSSQTGSRVSRLNCGPGLCGLVNCSDDVASREINALKAEIFELKMQLFKSAGMIEGLRIGIDSWARKPTNYFLHGSSFPKDDEGRENDNESVQSGFSKTRL